ncbi:UNVERIFIED_CONTAM: hypothetical protein Slati_0272500 [Sesamum latifolium]|uniref:DUF4005 domain-containing protein n=1 Tax=Sesamum latifolium TaxID=2727402 RepID=A0AAW2YDK7_9LAMI
MGKATRWLRGLLGLKKDKQNVDSNSNSGGKMEKRRWSFMKPAKDSGGLAQIPVRVPPADAAWLRSLVADSEKEQNKHAIAVAAATAAAADAAVAAAQAAVAVVRLTSQGREARKALRALRGLVKLQALVRGYLVRKRAAATLHSMQALIRAQAAIRSQRARRSTNNEHRFQPEMRARKSIERFDEARSDQFHSKRISASYDPCLNAFDETPKIVEIDTYGPKSRSRRMSTCMSEYGDDQNYQVTLSPLPCSFPNRLPIPDCRHVQDFDWGYTEEDYKFATAQSTPRFASTGRANAPATPAKSVCGDSFFRPYSNYPSYMANTQSFRAKLRSHSAPKQRPELGPKKRLSLNEVMSSRTSFSGVRMQRSCSQVEEEFEF